MSLHRKVAAALAAGVLLATGACGGGGRPSQDDVSHAFQDGVKSSKDSKQAIKLKKKGADCAAKVFVDSKLSDATLKSIVDDHIYKQNSTNDKVVAGLSGKLAKCGTGK